ncbi:MAG: ABC transporter ATP-binding protein [Actinomycetes bacterium]
MTAFLAAAGVWREFPARRGTRRGEPAAPALADVTFELAEGERVGLLGRSGSGKTTLLRCLLALEAPSRGAITCLGRPVRPARTAALRWYRRLVQYVPQDPRTSLDPRRSVAALVAEPLVRLRVPTAVHARVTESLAAVGLSATVAQRRPTELSGGQAQRVAIARAIATRPHYLLVDEPVSGLDLPLRDAMVDLLAAMSAEHGTGLLFVTHDLSTAARLCTRTLVLADGRLVADEPTSKLLATPAPDAVRELLDAVPRLPAIVG